MIELTGLPSGTVYPAPRRLERDGLVQSHWEQLASSWFPYGFRTKKRVASEPILCS